MAVAKAFLFFEHQFLPYLHKWTQFFSEMKTNYDLIPLYLRDGILADYLGDAIVHLSQKRSPG